jgi:hypothetical protein
MDKELLPLANRVFLAARDMEDSLQFINSLETLLSTKGSLDNDAYYVIE